MSALSVAQPTTADDLDGTWTMNISMASGTGVSTFRLVQQGESIAGDYKGQFGAAPVTGSVKSGVIAFGYQVEVQGVPVEVTYLGTVDGGVMSGTVTIVGFGDGTFKGTKQH